MIESESLSVSSAAVRSMVVGQAAPAVSHVRVDHLNDDCLYEIFEYLKLVDQLRFAMLNTRLSSVYQSYCQLHPIVLRKDDLNDLKLKEIRRFFAMVGSSIKALIQLPYKDCERNEYATLVNRYCSNVRSINFALTKIKSKCLRKVLANMENVTHMNLVCCALDDTAMLGVIQLHNLKTLNVSRNDGVTGKYLWKLKNLEELSLFNCGVVDEHLIEICKSLKQLKNIDITYCNQITDAGYGAVMRYCEQLEALKMSYYHAMTFNLLSRLKSLQFLSWEHIQRMGTEHVQQIATLSNLETISLTDCYELKNEDLLLVVRNCLKLKHLNVIFCKRITDEFVYSVIDVLKEQLRTKQRASTNEPMLFMVSKTRINKTILTDPRYLAAASILRLSFAKAYYYNYLYYTYSYDTDERNEDFLDFKHFYLRTTTFDYEN